MKEPNTQGVGCCPEQFAATPTPSEQALTVELAYYQQCDAALPTAEDLASWQRDQTVYSLLLSAPEAFQRHAPASFQRHVLERHGYSLHRYMARHLSQAAWACWFAHGSLLTPFC